MIKLISQFDNEKMRASVATPTCGPCCCCCCCCVVTAITSSILTNRHFGKNANILTPEEYLHSKDKSKEDRTKLYNNKITSLFTYLYFLILISFTTMALLSLIDEFGNINSNSFIIPLITIVMFFYLVFYTVKSIKYWYKVKTKVGRAILLSIVFSIIEVFLWFYLVSN